MFTKLLVIRMVARSCSGRSRSFRIFDCFSSFSISSMSVSVSAKNAVSEPETNAEQSRAAMAVRRATTLLAVGACAIKSGSAQSVAHII